MVTLCEGQYTFLIISHPLLFRVNNVVEKIETHIYVQSFFLNCTIYGIMGKNVVQQGRPQMTIWRMLIACWIPGVTKTQIL